MDYPHPVPRDLSWKKAGVLCNPEGQVESTILPTFIPEMVRSHEYNLKDQNFTHVMSSSSSESSSLNQGVEGAEGKDEKMRDEGRRAEFLSSSLVSPFVV